MIIIRMKRDWLNIENALIKIINQNVRIYLIGPCSTEVMTNTRKRTHKWKSCGTNNITNLWLK